MVPVSIRAALYTDNEWKIYTVSGDADGFQYWKFAVPVHLVAFDDIVKEVKTDGTKCFCEKCAGLCGPELRHHRLYWGSSQGCGDKVPGDKLVMAEH